MAMVALVVVLGVGLVVVLRGYLSTPSGGAGGTSGGGGSGGLSGPRAGGSTVAPGRLAPHETATFDTAQKALAAQEYAKAAAILTRLLEDDPDAVADPAVNLALAEALLGGQDYEGAYRQFERVLAIEGGKASPVLHFQAGTVAAKAGRLDRAEEHYSMAQSGDASRVEYPLYLAMVQLRQGKTEPGVANLLRAIKLDPECAEAYGTLAEVYLRDNKLEIAMPNIARARALQPRLARWRIVEAKILKRQAKPREALEVLLAMDEADRTSGEALTVTAECFGMLGMPAEAAGLYISAAKREPTNAEHHYQAALWLQRAGREAEALASAKTASMLGHAGAKELVGSLAAAGAE